MALPIVLLPEPLAPYIILICFKLFILMPSLLNVAMFLIDKDLIIDYNYFFNTTDFMYYLFNNSITL